MSMRNTERRLGCWVNRARNFSHFARALAIVVLGTVVLGMAGVRLAVADQPWNQFRGPNGAGVFDSDRWLPALDSESLAWEISVPPGYSSPVLSESLVFLTAIEEGRLWTIAIKTGTGVVAWKKAAPEVPLERVHSAGSVAASTPFVDSGHVLVYFGSYGLLCYDHAGELLWQKALPTPSSLYGMSTSPVIHKNLVILVLDDDSNMPESQLSRSKIIALRKDTGELVWETARPLHRSGWSTPTIWTHPRVNALDTENSDTENSDTESGMSIALDPKQTGDDLVQELVVLGNGRVCGYDLATGQQKWYVNGFSRETIARPIVGDGVIIAAAAMLGGVADENPDRQPFWEAVIQFDANGDKHLQREEMTGDFTFPFRPELPVGHPGFGLPLPTDPQQRRKRLDGMFQGIDADRDGRWTEQEFLKAVSFDRGKPNLIAIGPGGQGDVSTTHVRWALHRGIPETPSPLLFKNRIFMIADGGVLTVVDAEQGTVIHRKRLAAGGHYRSSPIVVGSQLLVASEQGVVTLLETKGGFEIVFERDFAEPIAATAAVDEQAIYLRTTSHLYAFRLATSETLKSKKSN